MAWCQVLQCSNPECREKLVVSRKTCSIQIVRYEFDCPKCNVKNFTAFCNGAEIVDVPDSAISLDK